MNLKPHQCQNRLTQPKGERRISFYEELGWVPRMENWVKLRHLCSPLEMFLQLKEGAKEDVETREKLVKDQDKGTVAFRIMSHNGKGFSVIREGHQISDWVEFTWEASGISVRNKDDKVVQKATLTLTDEGECKLRVSTGEELTCWQFRKRMLEDSIL